MIDPLAVAEYSCETTQGTASIRRLQALEEYVDRTFLLADVPAGR